jgi:cell division protein FtsQ
VRRLILPLAVLALLGGGYLWFRDSSFVAVRDVRVTGLSSNEGPEVRDALVAAARGMTTLHVREGDLSRAVSDFSSVAAVTASADFPHGLSVEVTEREPVAEVDLGGERVPVGAGGRLMRGVRPKGPLPVLKATHLAPGGRLTDKDALEAVRALAAAPAVLRPRVNRVWLGPKGLTLELRSGPELFFGGTGRLDAKWMAAARVMAEPSAAGAVYLDVRIPERVAAGGLGSVPEDAVDPLASTTEPQEANPQVQAEGSATLNP